MSIVSCCAKTACLAQVGLDEYCFLLCKNRFCAKTATCRNLRRLGEFDGLVEGSGEDAWDESDYFKLLTEYAIRGLVMLGCPKPQVLAAALQTEDQKGSGGATRSTSERRKSSSTLLGRLLSCCFTGSGREAAGGCDDLALTTTQGPSFNALSEQDVEEVRSLLLVLIIAAGNAESLLALPRPLPVPLFTACNAESTNDLSTDSALPLPAYPVPQREDSASSYPYPGPS